MYYYSLYIFLLNDLREYIESIRTNQAGYFFVNSGTISSDISRQ